MSGREVIEMQECGRIDPMEEDAYALSAAFPDELPRRSFAWGRPLQESRLMIPRPKMPKVLLRLRKPNWTRHGSWAHNVH